MRRIEGYIDIPEQACDDFRRSVMVFIGLLYIKKKDVTWDFHPQLRKAFELELNNAVS